MDRLQEMVGEMQLRLALCPSEFSQVNANTEDLIEVVQLLLEVLKERECEARDSEAVSDEEEYNG